MGGTPRPPMVLDELRPGWERALHPIMLVFARLKVTPNMLSAVSLVAALGAGWAFYVSDTASPLWLLVASALIGVNAIMDSVDGILARYTDSSSRLGDLFDHVIDRYSDLALLVGLTLSSWVDYRIGVFAIVGTSLTSYMGTQAQALGLGRNYRGLLGRADRIFLLIAVPVFEYLRIILGYGEIYGFTLLGLLVIWIAFAGNVTALQRIRDAISQLKE